MRWDLSELPEFWFHSTLWEGKLVEKITADPPLGLRLKRQVSDPPPWCFQILPQPREPGDAGISRDAAAPRFLVL